MWPGIWPPSPGTVAKWWQRWCAEGEADLMDRCLREAMGVSAPASHSRAVLDRFQQPENARGRVVMRERCAVVDVVVAQVTGTLRCGFSVWHIQLTVNLFPRAAVVFAT